MYNNLQHLLHHRSFNNNQIVIRQTKSHHSLKVDNHLDLDPLLSQFFQIQLKKGKNTKVLKR